MLSEVIVFVYGIICNILFLEKQVFNETVTVWWYPTQLFSRFAIHLFKVEFTIFNCFHTSLENYKYECKVRQADLCSWGVIVKLQQNTDTAILINFLPNFKR